ncbi:hypothetical protein [Litorimonas sp. WD9-15]|uniref:hypothetical protein n=1 Tax=Litorimonas sp. WD9-15 TaxID=3418716 RepID=UPI003CFC3211
MFRATLISLGALSLPVLAAAQDIAPVALPAVNQDMCITQMAEFPTDDAVARYQFFKLVQDTAFGADEGTQILLNHYGQPAVESGTPVLAVIEDIANPVLRQAAPEIIVASMDYMIDFAQACDIYITGQMDSLLAFDATLTNPDFNAAIAEDALFLRQILSESLTDLGADEDPQWAGLVAGYSSSLIAQRDAVEFQSFETEIAELETLFMDDLDGRLKRSNDVINSEMDRGVLRDSVRLSNDMSEAALEKAKQERLYRLIRIFGGGG